MLGEILALCRLLEGFFDGGRGFVEGFVGVECLGVNGLVGVDLAGDAHLLHLRGVLAAGGGYVAHLFVICCEIEEGLW